RHPGLHLGRRRRAAGEARRDRPPFPQRRGGSGLWPGAGRRGAGRRVMARGTVLLLSAALLLAAACARQVPPSSPAAALYRDLERLVAVAEATGWKVDRLEVDRLLPAVLASVCRVRPEVRAAVTAWIDQEIAAAGGPVEEAYR